MVLAAAIRDARGKHTQTWLADEIGVDQTTVSRWELGKSVPSLRELREVEEALNLLHGELILRSQFVTDEAITRALDAAETLKQRTAQVRQPKRTDS